MRRILLLLVTICLGLVAKAQTAASYNFSQLSGTFTSISGSGTSAYASGWDDNTVASFALGFTFTAGGTAYTSCRISTNGYVTFGTTAPGTTAYTPISGTTGYAFAICALGGDLIANGSPIYYQMTGSSPNRVFTVEWRSFSNYSSGNLGQTNNMQIQLYETSNIIKIVYGSFSGSSTTTVTRQIGLRGSSNSDYNNRSTSTNWSATTRGTANNNTCSVQTSSALNPTSGLTFQYCPTAVSPTVTMSGSPACSPASFTAGGASTYTWAPSTGLSATTGTSSTATVSSNTTYTVTGIASNGCSGTVTATANANPAAITGASSVCTGRTTTLTGPGGGTWSTSAAGTASVTSGGGVVTGVAAGSATITYTVTATGCYTTTPITVNQTPTVSITPSATFKCSAGSAVTLTASGSGSSYTWAPGATLSATTGSAVSASPSANTTYTATSTLGSCTNTATQAITYYVSPGGITPYVGMSDTNICFPGFSQMLDAGTGGTWSSSNPSIFTVSVSGGVYALSAGSAYVYYSSPCGTDSLQIHVNSGGFTLSVTPSSSTYCSSGSGVSITASSTDAGTDTWLWTDISGGAAIGLSSTTTPTTVATPSVSAVYAIFGTNSTTGCHAVITDTVISTTPAAITGTNTVCMGSTRTYSCSTGGGTWSSSATGIATVNSGSGLITPVSAGTATITYTVTATGCYVVRAITVNALPSLSASPTTAAACGGTGVAITASGAATYTWAPNTSLSATTGSTVTANPASATTYTITGTDANGCVNTVTKSVGVGANIMAGYFSPAADSVCPGATDVLTGQVARSSTSYTITSITYSPPSLSTTSTGPAGDDATGSSVLPFTFNFFGTNYSTVFYSSNGFIDFSVANSVHSSGITIPNSTSVALASINAFYSDISVGSPGYCEYDTLGTSPYRSFVFHTINGPCCSGGNTFEGWIVLYETSNVIDVLVNRTESRTQICGIQNGAGTLGFCPTGRNGVTYQVTTPEAWRFTPNVPGTTYAWSPGGSLSATTGTPVTATIGSTTTYTLTVTDPSSGCNGSFSRTVAAYTPPSISISPSTVCVGTTMTASGASTYTWSPATGLTSTTGASVTPTSYTAITYTATGTDAHGCIGTATKAISFPTISVSPTSATYCSGTSAIGLSASGTSVSYSWSPAAGLSAVTGAGVNASPTITTTYTVTGTDALGCTNVATSAITQYNTPTTITGSSSTLCLPGTMVLSTDGTGGSWSSSASGVATVDPVSGVVTGVSAGSCTITYDNVTCGYATYALTVANGGFTVSTTPTSGTYCASGSALNIVASDGGAGATFTWSPAAGLDATTGATVNASPTVTTIYTVMGVAGACSNSTTITVTNNTPSAITGTNTVCLGSSRTYSCATGGGTWSSSATGIATVDASTGVIFGASAGTATITYTVTATGCYVTRAITVNALPTLTFTPTSAAACGGIGVAVTASGAVTYTWAPNTALSATTGATVTANPGSSTTYTITGTDANGCVNTGTKTVGVGSTYMAAYMIPASDTVCPGGTDVLTGAVASSSTSYTVTSITYAPPTLATTSAGPTGDDATSTAVMPFTFNFFGVNYTSVNFSTNGFINFGAATTLHSSGITIPNSTSIALASINAFYSDISVGGAGSCEYDTLGTAPNRRYVFHTVNGPCCSGGNTFEGWIVLYETSNVIDVLVNRTESRTQICGIQNGGGTLGFTPSGRNGVIYQVTTPEAWRFTPDFSTATYTWAPGGSLSATTGNPVTGTVTGATTFTVTVTDPGSGCNGSYTKTIYNYTPPTISISPSTVCVGTTMTASGATSYTWAPTTGLSSTNTAATVSSSYAVPTYTVTGTDGHGCTATATRNISYPTISVAPPTSIFCSAGSPVTLTASGTSVSYSWSPSAGLSAVTGASVNASPTVTTVYTVTGTDATGCSGPATATVTYNATPLTITGAGGSSTICLPGTLLLSTDGTGGNWSSSDTTIATVDAGGFVTGVSTGSVTITYNNTTCGYATYGVTVLPGGFTVSLTPSSGTYCASGSALSVTASGATTYSWSPSAGLTATTGATVAASPAATTTYTVIGTTGGCTNTALITVTNNTPAAISGASSVCSGLTTAYTDATGGGTWSSSAPTVASVDASTGTVYGLTAGSATITYTVTATGCYVTQGITVNATPSLSFTPASAQACGGIGVAITASGASTYTWTPATGLSATTGATVTANPTSATTYTIVGTSAAGCTATATKFVGYSATLITAYATSSPSNVCPGGTTTLSTGISSSTTTYSVNSITYSAPTLSGTTAGPTGDDAFTGVSIPFTFNFYGVNYTALNITTNGFLNFGTGTTLHSSGITIPNAASVGLASINAFYSDISVGGTGSCEYVTTGTAPNRKFTFHTINGPCCSGGNTFEGWIILYETSNIIDVLVNRTENRTQICGIQNVTGTIGVTPSGRNGVTYQVTTPEAWRFAPSFPTATYAWTPAAGVTSTTATTTTATVSSTTVYTITATDPASGCFGTATATVNTYTAPTVTISPSVVCSGVPMTAAGASTYTWGPAAGLSSTTGATVTPTPTVVTTYTVTGVDTNGCTGTATKTISFPTVSLSPTSALYCSSGSPVGITATGTGVSYAWSPSAGLSATTGTSVNASPTTNTVYTVTAYDASGCTATALDTITYNIATGSISGPSSTLCLPGTMLLTETGTGGIWSSSDTTLSVVNSSGIVTGITTGTYTITYDNPACGGFATYGLTNVNGGFTISVSPSSGTYCSTGSPLSATASGATTYTWLPSAGLDVTTGATVNASPTVTTIYTVTGTTSGCSNSATLTVTNNTPAPITGGLTTLCSATSGAISTTSTTWTCATGGGTWSSSAPTVATVNPSTGAITGLSAGTATITYDISGCYVTRSITINASPALSFTPTSAAACGGASVVVTASGASTYSWAPSTFLSSTVSASPTVSPTVTTTYTITGTSAAGCVSTATKTVGYSGTAMLAYASSSPTQVCTGGITTLNGYVASSATSYTVSSITYSPPSLSTTTAGPTGDDAFAARGLPFTFNFFGINYTSLNVTTNGFLNFGTGTTLHSSGITIPNAASVGLASINAFYSDISVGGTGSSETDTLGTSPNRSYVFHTINGPCCSGGNTFEGWIILYESSNVIDVLVNRTENRTQICGIQNVTGTIGFTPSGRNGVTYQVTTPEAWRFTPVLPTATYAWTPSAGVTSSAAATTTATVTATTTYTVTVTDPATGCNGTFTTTDTAVAQPTVTLTTTQTNFCSGGQDSLIATPSGGVGPITLYTWSGPGIATTTGTVASASFTPTTAATATGAYTVSVAYAGSGCNNAVNTSASVTIEPDPTVTVSPSATSLCPGDNLILTESLVSGGVGTPTYSWSGPGITTTTGSSSTSPTFTPTVSSGAYSVAVTYSGRGCNVANANTATVTVNATPTAYAMTGGSTGCTNTGVTMGLANSQTGVTYELRLGGTGTGITASGTTGSPVSFGLRSTAGTYDVIATGPGGCTGIMTGTIVIYTSPTAYTITGGNACSSVGITIGVSNSQTGVDYRAYRNIITPAGSAVSGTGSAMTSITTQTTAGNYTVIGTDVTTGCPTTMNGVDTIYPTPTIVLGANPSICLPASTANLAYSSTTGSPTTYSIVWDSAAFSAGFSNVTGASLTSSPIVLSVASTPGTWNGTLTVSNSNCTSTTYSFNVTVYAHPTAAITSYTPPCMGYPAVFVFTGTSGAIAAYKIDGGSPINVTMTGGTYTLITAAITSSHTYTLYDAHNPVCTTVLDTSVSVVPTPMAWTGTTSSDWNTASNWSCGFAPASTDDVSIPSGTPNAPSIGASATGSARNLTVASGVTVTVNSGAFLNVTGNITTGATVTGSGYIRFNGSTAQTIAGNSTFKNMTLNNASGLTINTGTKVTVKGVVGVSAGTLYTNDSLTLYADSTGTGRVDSLPASGAAISGQVKVMVYVQGGRRAYRFWSHPFNSYIGLNQAVNYIDITGPGGTSNGFTYSASSAPSAFRYNPLVGNSFLASDPGWKQFSSAYTSVDSNRLHQYQGIRMFFRGAKGQGLGYETYTPSAVQVSQWGNLNQGTQTVTLSKGTSNPYQEYNMVGNPYASPVNIGRVIYNALVAGNVVGPAYFVWNPSLGSAGQFQPQFISTVSAVDYYMQACNAFQVRAAYNGATLTFNENQKGSTPTSNLFRSSNEYVSLKIYDAKYQPYDMVYLQFHDQASEGNDYNLDAVKPMGGADLNFYSIASDNSKMIVDARPYDAEKVIPLGIASDTKQEFIIKAETIAVPAGGQLYLHDKLLKQYVRLSEGTEYRFAIDDNKATQGNDRFEISMKPATAIAAKGLQVSLVPNPTSDDVNISFVNGKTEEVSVRILDLSGVSVYNQNLGAQQSGSVKVSLTNFAAGIYMVELTSGDQKVVQRLVKE